MLKRKLNFYQRVAFILAIYFLAHSLVVPVAAFALTSGPKQPEFTSFTPVATTNMVNTFTGGFNYNLPVLNIPGPDGGGYALSLAYNSQPNPEEQASWVGLGWNINPGALQRNKRGFADDANGIEVVKYNKTTPNWTVSAGDEYNLELASKDESGNANDNKKLVFHFPFKKNGGNGDGTDTYLTLGYNENRRTNNSKGFLKSSGISISGYGTGLGVNWSGEQTSFSLTISPLYYLSRILNGIINKKIQRIGSDNSSDNTKSGKIEKLRNFINGYNRVSAPLSGSFNLLGYAQTMGTTVIPTYWGRSYDANFKFGIGSVVKFEKGWRGNFNFQRNIESTTHAGYGFLYNPSRGDFDGNKQLLYDYYTENSPTVNLRTHVLGIPFNNYDVFNVTGEGIGGSFRLHRKDIGHYFLPEMTPRGINDGQNASIVGSFNMGLDFSIHGVGLGVGVGFGGGQQIMKQKRWVNVEGYDNYVNNNGNSVDYFNFTSSPEDHFFRFNGDMGGVVEYGETGHKVPTTVLDGVNLPLFKKFYPVYKSDSKPCQSLSAKGASSAIEKVSLNGITDQNALDVGAFNFYSLGNLSEQLKGGHLVNGLVTTNARNSSIGQFRVTQANGMVYNYGLPVFAKNEENLHIGLVEDDETTFPLNTPTFRVDPNSTGNRKTRNIAYKSNVQNALISNKQIVGEAIKAAYPTSYLVTSILTPDYVDATDDGPTEDDFGGYTKFNYDKIYGHQSAAGWFHYRTPYNGLIANWNNLADNTDEWGSVSRGDKEIYFLKSIETKSHIAKFITSDREDGLDANGDLQASSAGNVKGTRRLKKLDRIELYSKKDLVTPIQTVNFAYDYSLCSNIPNNSTGNYPDLAVSESGKLTLKKVWFEYAGVKKYKVSPYQFVYQYDSHNGQNINSALSHFYNFQLPQIPYDKQNPKYDPNCTDWWGNIAYNGNSRKYFFNTHTYQGSYADAFDPAAWQLKKIILPSGGELHVEYDQHDYTSVQNRKPMAMVSLLEEGLQDNVEGSTKYYLNLGDIGVDPGMPNYSNVLNQLKDYIQTNFVGKEDKRLFFKFLYDLKGDFANLNELGNSSTFVSGFASVGAVDVDPSNNKLFITLGEQGSSGGNYDNQRDIPRRLCYDYVHNEWNMTDLVGKDRFIRRVNENMPTDMSCWSLIDEYKQLGLQVMGDIKPQDVCKDLDVKNSYIRIPMLHKAKKGGGVRVKRLLMYDRGIGSYEQAVYGTEYSYTTSDGMSSGVASNEPSGEENALVEYDPRMGQHAFTRVIGGHDMEEAQLPYGESILPQPSIGYSRVVVSNIHKGITGTGVNVTEFYTYKDFPYDGNWANNDMAVQKTNLGHSHHNARDYFPLPLAIFNYHKDHRWLTQGFQFIQHDMNGKPKSEKTYADSDDKFRNPTTETVYSYFSPGENLPVLRLSGGDNIKIETGKPLGKTEEFAMEQRSMRDFSWNLDAEIDVRWTYPLIFDISFFGAFSMTDQALSTHVTSKVVSYTCPLKSVVKKISNMETERTDHLAFNEYNGEPLLTRTLDAYSGITNQGNLSTSTDKKVHAGSYYSIQIPANWKYGEFNPKFEFSDQGCGGSPNSTTTGNNQLDAKIGSIVLYNGATTNSDFKDNPNSDAVVSWLRAGTSTQKPPGVKLVSATAMSFAKDWFDNQNSDPIRTQIDTDYGIPQGALANLNKIMRPNETFLYEGGQATPSDNYEANSDHRIYNSGLIESFSVSDFFTLFSNPQQNPNGWKTKSRTKHYSPNGYALQEELILKGANGQENTIPSTAKYGYYNYLPLLVAQNAEYNTVDFESFEEENPLSPPFTNSVSHSGKISRMVTQTAPYSFSLGTVQAADHLMKNEGGAGKMEVRCWVNGDYSSLRLGIVNTTPTKIAQSGEWTLVRFENTFIAGQPLSFIIENTTGSAVYIDDIRVQPIHASMSASVYDIKTFKLLASFDDQHFGVFYQYNDEGQLMRKIIETEKGLKTIQENHQKSRELPR